tara:strand:+ start:384 stop:632 length:249 start_codon:yes stop_codon:yes gene_type:complete
MSKTHKRIQTSMRFKPETLKILDRYQSERAIPRTYLIETIIDQWHAQQTGSRIEQKTDDITTRVKNLESAIALMLASNKVNA